MNIETDRLKLVPVTEEYISDVFENFTIEITRYTFPSPAKDIDETKSVIRSMVKQRVDKTDYVYAITKKDSGEFLGLAGLHNLKKESPELGVWTKLDSHGNHYGREAIGGLIKLAKELGYKTVVYPVDRKNISSKKIPIYYGGKIIIDKKLEITPDGRVLEEEIYEISLR